MRLSPIPPLCPPLFQAAVPSRSQGNSTRPALLCRCGQHNRPSKETPAQAAEGATQMIHRPASSQPRPARRGTPRTRRTLTALSGLAVFLTAAIGLAPAASAIRVPPPGGGGAPPPSPPPTTVAAHFPLWAVIAIVAATVVLSVATTLVTLSLEQMRRARRTPAAVAEPRLARKSPQVRPSPNPSRARSSPATTTPTGHDMPQADSR